jgi:hypothetical protein
MGGVVLHPADAYFCLGCPLAPAMQECVRF